MIHHPELKSGRPNRGRIPRFSTILFCFTLVALLASLLSNAATLRSLSERVEELRNERDRLSEQLEQRQAAVSQSVQDKEMLIRMFRHCRSADDVPPLGGERIVSNQIDGGSVAFYVPSGGHQLRVDTSWKPVEKKNSSGGDAATVATSDKTDGADSMTGQQSWTVDLIGGHGYFFTVAGEQNKVTQVGWELSSNAPGFDPRAQSIGLPPIRSTGASWSILNVAVFPNETDFRTITNYPKNAAPPQPLRIGRWKKFGRQGQTSIQANIELTISSDSPIAISATNAKKFFAQKNQRWIFGYLGGGRYSVLEE